MLDKQVIEAFDAELVKKGLTKTSNDNADLYIGYQLAIGQEKQMNAYTTGGADWGYGAGWGGGMGMTTAATSTISVGKLVVDMYAPATKHLVWRSMASKTIDMKAKPEKREKNLAKATARMLKNYPPKVKT